MSDESARPPSSTDGPDSGSHTAVNPDSPARSSASLEAAGTSSGLALSVPFKIFLGNICLLIVVLVTVMAIVRVRTAAVGREAIDLSMLRMDKVLSTFVQENVEQGLEGARRLAEEPSLRAVLATGDPGTVASFLATAVNRFDATYLVALDTSGQVLARTDRPEMVGEDLSSTSPLYSDPLAGHSITGLEPRGTNLTRVAAVPVTDMSQRLLGVLVVATPFGRDIVMRSRDVTSANVSLLTEPRDQLLLRESSLGSDQAEALRDHLLELSSIDESVVGKTVGPFEIDLLQDPTTVIAQPLGTVAGERIGYLVASRSLHRETAPYRRLRETILWTSLLAIPLAGLISFVLARRITRPLSSLVDATERVIDGHLDITLPQRGRDEIGLLSSSLGRLIVQLRQNRDLVSYLRQLKPEAMTELHGTFGNFALDGGRSQDRFAPIEPGTTLTNRYYIHSRLGRGGMGEVFRAQDRELEEQVAIKVIRGDVASDPKVLERFKSEIRLARRIAHPRVLRVHELGEAAGNYYITMELFEGTTLRDLLERSRPIPPGPALNLAMQACAGLEAAHEQGVIHRDVKPANMLVNEAGQLKIMDFGISRLADAKGVTKTGGIIGTPEYMSPEQAQGQPLDHRTDIYALGLVFYEMFCGRLPFEGSTPLALLMARVQDDPYPPEAANPDLPSRLCKILRKMLQRDREQRHADLAELSADLDRLTDMR
ncbi:MAG: protein kinase [Acidobacteriota bacterium]